MGGRLRVPTVKSQLLHLLPSYLLYKGRGLRCPHVIYSRGLLGTLAFSDLRWLIVWIYRLYVVKAGIEVIFALYSSI